MEPLRTTHGVARLHEGTCIVIEFGILDDNNNLSEVALDVDAYATVLLRDLAGCVVIREDREGIV